MHGVMGKLPPTATKNVAASKLTLLLLVAMTGVAPISLYMLVPALPKLATAFGRDISLTQMTVSLYMVGIACSQLVMGPLSDRWATPAAAFGSRPDGRGERSLHLRAKPAATDYRAIFAGARRRKRHGDQPRHHPRPL